jgi:hypothetical protein
MAATGFTGFFADMAAYGVSPAWVNAKPHRPVYLGVTNDADFDRVTELATFHELRWTVRHKRVVKASGTFTEHAVTLRAGRKA